MLGENEHWPGHMWFLDVKWGYVYQVFELSRPEKEMDCDVLTTWLAMTFSLA